MRIPALICRVRTAQRLTLIFLVVLMQGAAVRAQQAPETWMNAGSLLAARANHTATLLNDGRVLIAGGEDASGILATAEIFDPVSGASQPTKGALTNPRKNHTALLLNDGRVLIAGGEDANGVLASAEAFDSRTGTFTALGSMSQARRYHTATLLNDGTVVVTGGEDSSGKGLVSIEKFDAQSGYFTLVKGQLDVPRAQHSATLLQDGRVLIVGGRTGATALASTVYFDPSLDTVSVGLFLAEARYAHTATRVLWGNVVFAGGTSDGKTGIDLIELLDVQGNKMGFASNRLSVGRWNHAAIVPPNNGNLILVGGQNGNGPVAAADILDPESFLSSPLPNLETPRSELGAFQGGNGRVCVAGGNGLKTPLQTVESSSHATVKSDRADYPPNTKVTLTGTGWTPGEMVTLTIRESDGDPDTVLPTVADASGNITSSGFQTNNGDKRKAFLVKAAGATSKRTAYTRFTDLGATITLNPASFNVTPNPVTVQIFGTGFSLGTNQVCFYQGAGNTLVYCTGYGSSQLTTVSDSEVDVVVGSQVTSVPGGYNVQVQQEYYVNQTCSYTYCYSCGWGSTCCYPVYYNCGYWVTFSSGLTPLTVTQIPTTLTGVPFGVVANFGDIINVSAWLTDSSSNPVSNETIQFTLPGSLTASAVTNSSGMATASVSLGSLAAGFYPNGIQISFAGDTNYASSSTATNLTVRQLTPAITWNTPTPIIYGTLLSSAQLNATATGLGGAALPGSFSYNPGATTLLPAGIATLGVTFTPADTTDYTTATQSVNLVVNQAVPALSWSAPAAISYGTALSSTQLNATATGVGGAALSGTFVYTPAAGTVLAGGTQTLSAVFTPNDTTDYTSASASVPLVVNAASTTTALSLSSTSVSMGTSVALTATVSSGGNPVAPGMVTFCDGSAPYCLGSAVLGTAELTSGGTATINLTFGWGARSIYAAFAGTRNYTGSSSAPQTLTVNGINSSATQISSSGSAGNYTLTATVTGNGTTAPTGTVSFLDTTNSNLSLGTAALGSGTTTIAFSPTAALTTGNAPSAIAFGDFNGDGKQDLVLANTSDNTVTVLLGNGDGTFTAASSTPATGVAPRAMVVGDFNGDGKQDLAIANASDNTVTVLLGNGDGTFTAASSTPATGVAPSAIAVGDFNGDGKQDLAIANANDNTVTVLLGNGDGTFVVASSSPATGLNPSSLAVGDFNGDGKMDIAVTNLGSNSITVLLGKGDGTFTATVSPNTGNSPSAIVIGDFNGDGEQDLAFTNSTDATVGVLLGNGDGTFTAASSTAATGVNPRSLIVSDFNGDGKQDLSIANFGDNTVSVLLGNGDGTFSAATAVSVGSNPIGLVVGDFNGDGKRDLATANNGNQSATVLLGNPTTVVTATSSGLAAWGGGTHNIDASYPGDTNYSSSVSSGISLAGTPIVNTITLSISPSANLSFGQSVELSASVSPGSADNYAPGGTVTLYDGSTVVGTVTLSSGQAVLTTSALTGGSHNLTASYSGDANFAASTSAPIILTVNQFSPTLTWNAPQAVTYGTALSATQLNAAAKGVGSVSLSGTFTYTPAAGTVLGVGTQTLSVTFTPTDSTDYTSATSSVSLVVSQENASVALASSNSTQLLGNPVTFTATVAPTSQGAGVPTGTVIFQDGAVALGVPVTLNGSGTASYTSSSLAVGAHSIAAVYSGDANNLARTSAALTQMIQESTSASIAASTNPLYAGTSVTFTASVTASGSGTPTGTVVFKDGSATLGSAALNGSGTATYSTTGLTVGSHAITATYSGDANNVTSTSSALTVTVNQFSPTVTWNAPQAIAYGAALSATQLNATAKGVGGVPLAGTFTYTPAAGMVLGAGTQTLSVTFTPTDSTDYTSATSSVSLVVSQENASVALVSSNSTQLLGNSVTFTATVAPTSQGAGVPTGTVIFEDSATVLGSPVALNGSGTASYTSSSLAVGPHSITAVYSGDANNLARTSAALTQMIQESTSASIAASTNPLYAGTSVTFTASVTASGSGTPTGTVVFKDGSTTLGSGTLSNSGTTTYSTTGLTVGSHAITAAYSGDANNVASASSALSLTVNPADFTLAATPATQTITDGQTATFSLNVTPHGSFASAINFSCSGLPALTTCSFSPASVTPNSNAVSTTLSITTVGRAATFPPPRPNRPTRPPFYAAGILATMLAIILALLAKGEMNSRLKALVPVGFVLLVVISLAACAGNGGSGGKAITPIGTTQLVVTANSTAGSGSVNHTTTLTLTVQ